MLLTKQIIKQAQYVLRLEAEAIERLIPTINQQFVQAIELILATKGRVITTGMGKPGYIAHKISATLMSTGTPSFYLHPAEGIHGDLGMITQDDIVIALSNSGETAEIINVLPIITRIGAPIIAICGNSQSTLAQHANITLDASIIQEACPLGLAPTTSTTAALAIGDAIAITLMSVRQFTADNFALYHPGGALGKKLLLTIEFIMQTENNNPSINIHQSVAEALFVITEQGMGATSVIDDSGRLVGIITDGDIRRCLSLGYDFLDKKVSDIMTQNPTTITKDKLASEALNMMEIHQPKPITVLPIVDKDGLAVGMIHVTQLLKHKML